MSLDTFHMDSCANYTVETAERSFNDLNERPNQLICKATFPKMFKSKLKVVHSSKLIKLFLSQTHHIKLTIHGNNL